MNIDPRTRATFSDIDLIIREAERIVIGHENMAEFSFDNNKGAALDKVVRKAISKREEERIQSKPGLSPPRLRADLLDALEQLKSADAPSHVAYYALEHSKDPILTTARRDNTQFALANVWIEQNLRVIPQHHPESKHYTGIPYPAYSPAA